MLYSYSHEIQQGRVTYTSLASIDFSNTHSWEDRQDQETGMSEVWGDILTTSRRRRQDSCDIHSSEVQKTCKKSLKKIYRILCILGNTRIFGLPILFMHSFDALKSWDWHDWSE